MEKSRATSVFEPSISESMPHDKPPRWEKAAPGSLDRRRHYQSRVERDQKSRSSYLFKNPPLFLNFATCKNQCLYPHDYCFDHFENTHEVHPQRFDNNPIFEQHQRQRLMETGCHPGMYDDCGIYRHDYQCSYHMRPHPCCSTEDRNCHYIHGQHKNLKVSNTCFC